MPCRVYYFIHRQVWAFQSSLVRQEVRGPETPLPLTAEVQASFSSAVDYACNFMGIPGPSSSSSAASCRREQSSSWLFWVPLVLVSSLGVGAALWMYSGKDGQFSRPSLLGRFLEVQEQVNQL